MTFGTMERIQTVTVGAGGAANIEFTNIPQTYSDLYILLSLRSNDSRVTTWVNLQPNGSTANGTSIQLYGNGSSAISGSLSRVQLQAVPGNGATASTFGNASIYITNYTSSNNKSFSGDSVSETNATATEMGFDANLWSNSAAITSFRIVPGDGTAWMQHSTATLYGITRVPAGAKATGGVIYDDATHFYHVFTSSGTFTPSQSLSCDVLVIAGGGASGISRSSGRGGVGGGGAGGFLGHGNQSLVAQNYTVTVGAGGSSNSQGSNSQFGSLTASVGGGFGGNAYNPGSAGGAGGSGGGGGTDLSTNYAGGTATSGQGFAGGTGGASFSTPSGAGGGGAGAVGGNGGAGNGGAGGNGVSTYSSWGLATNTGQNISGTVWYAGGGGGSAWENAGGTGGAGGNGGGGAGAANQTSNGTNGIANTGGGGGGGANLLSTTGGSGIVIVRYAK